MTSQLYQCLLLLAFLMGLAPASTCAAQETPAARPLKPGTIVPQEALVLGPLGRERRTPLRRDPLEPLLVTGAWTAPRAGETVTLPDGRSREWKAISATDGEFRDSSLSGGYAFVTVPERAPRVMLLEASGHTMVTVNGEPRIGDPYETGWVRLPIQLREGQNELLFRMSRGRLRVRLTPPTAEALLDVRDATLPDLIAGENKKVRAAVVVLNATPRPITGLKLTAIRSGTRTVTRLPVLPPLSTRKVGIQIDGTTGPSPDGVTEGPDQAEVALALTRHEGDAVRTLDTGTIRLRIRRPTQTYKRTFVSEIDGSVQYYAVHPQSAPVAAPSAVGAGPRARPHPAPALFLTLHGAGVEAIGQADAYAPKSWGHLVAPTNRRPYGFDWEDWGRLDALEVLERARRQLGTDPRRAYLTGHSMGGHGAWHLGVTYPDRFAAVGPSAGWISFASYGGGARAADATPMQRMLERAALPSDTLALAENLAGRAVSILHGDADDNVPVREARTMRDRLQPFHQDLAYHEQPGAGHWWDLSPAPGADCVDWAPMFDLFSHRTLPALADVREVVFATADPGVSSRCHWATIAAQLRPLQHSRIRIRALRDKGRFMGTTENVARLSLDLAPLGTPDRVSITLDGQSLNPIPSAHRSRPIWLARIDDRWQITPPPPRSLKGPERCGPFKQAFRHRVLFVYGTKGTDAENAWALAKARFDAETFWYRGNGSIDVVPDTDFDAAKERDRSVILYGNADTNAAWNDLLAGSPVEARRGSIRVGERRLGGTNLGCIFLRPRPGSARALVGVVGGTGVIGMRVTDRLPYFISGVGYPDLLILGPDALARGSEEVRVAGFFGNDWSVERGELVWGG
jgi:pimeloyl-ACP methyl ester carboxylesterase